MTTGIDRRKLKNSLNCQEKGKGNDSTYKTDVEFIERSENSTTLPGKKDTKTVQKEVRQKHNYLE